MTAINKLPEGYREIFAVNLQKDKKVYAIVNGLSLLIALVFAVPMHFHVSILTVFDMSKGLTAYILRFLALFVLMLVYIILHELTHGVVMKIYGTKKVKYGFKGVFAYAGSEDYYDKKSYIIIALAPVVIWGIIIAFINAFVPIEWFWVVYYIQLLNLSGAAGDIYVTVKFSKFPKDILVADSGIGMTVYSKEG